MQVMVLDRQESAISLRQQLLELLHAHIPMNQMLPEMAARVSAVRAVGSTLDGVKEEQQEASAAAEEEEQQKKNGKQQLPQEQHGTAAELPRVPSLHSGVPSSSPSTVMPTASPS